MLLDIYRNGNVLRQDDDDDPGIGGGGGVDESRPFTLFNDLTYSDDEEGVDWREMEQSFGGDSHTSSPDTAALLNEIQQAMLPTREAPYGYNDFDGDDGVTSSQHQQEQLHLIHPLAHYDSFRNSEGDEGSQLAYSITSSVMSSPNTTNYGSLEPAAPYFDYNNNNSNSNNTAKSTAVIFRSPPTVFHSTDLPSPMNTSTVPTNALPQYLKPKLSQPQHTRVEKGMVPPTQSSTTAIHRRLKSKYDKVKANSKSILKLYQLITPLPSITNDSPATSATATDTTVSPNENIVLIDPHQYPYPHPPHPPPLTPADARECLNNNNDVLIKRQRKHRRLRRIKKAAEVREGLVQKVRGVEQQQEQQSPSHSTSSSSSSSCNDSIFAYAFLCQFLLVSMSALAFGSGALWDMIHPSTEEYYDDGGSSSSSSSTTSTTNADRNPFAGLETDDVIITDGGMVRGGGGASGNRRDGYGNLISVTDGISDIDFINVIQLVCIASGYACLCSLLSLGFMMMLSKNALHVMLMFTIAVCLAWTIMGLAFSPNWITPLVGALASTLILAYTVVVWDRIAFAATNLSVALKGMRSTFDIPCVGYCVLAVTFLWTVWWIFALIGTLNFLSDDEEISDDLIYVVVAFFLFSYYWTFQVIKGISQATVATIIGKWWGVADDDPLPLYSADLRSKIKGRIVGSIGSICLGSLIVDPCIALSRITNFSLLARSTIACVPHPKQQYVTGSFENASTVPHCDSLIPGTVNQWSFTYIGLYGYKFWDSGSKASQLFEARGWTHIVSDDLVMTVMGMSSMIIGGSTALLGLIVEEVDGYYFTSSIQKPITTTFLICFLVGYFLSSAFLSIVDGCISAILVCYAASPVEFHANHNKLSEEMKSVWRQFWLQKPR